MAIYLSLPMIEMGPWAPDRWRTEDVRSKFLAFGGAQPHECIGKHLALLELQLFVKILCKDYDFKPSSRRLRNADLELPHLEFEIRPIAKRQIDTLYNHLVQAVDEIEMHAQALETIMKTVDNLRELLDVPKPFELIIHDPNGASEFHPMDWHGQGASLAGREVVRLRWRPPGERAHQVLVKEIKNSNGKRKLLTRRMLHGETWEASALHCIEEDLVMKPRTGKQLLAQKAFDAKSYTFFQEPPLT
eukprot:g422.t1